MAANESKPVLLSKEEMYAAVQGGTVTYQGRIFSTRQEIDDFFGKMAEKEEDVEQMEAELGRLEGQIAELQAQRDRLVQRIPEVRKSREARRKDQDQQDRMRAMNDAEKAALIEANATLQAQWQKAQEQMKKAGLEPELVLGPGAEAIVSPPEPAEPPRAPEPTRKGK